jgi:hypothetical protein
MTAETFTVRRTRIAGTNCHVYTVWESSALMGPHSTITSNPAGGWFGRLGTRRLPNAVDAIPVGPVRFVAVDCHHAAQYRLAYAAIRTAFGAIEGRADMGEIEEYLSEHLPDESRTVTL